MMKLKTSRRYIYQQRNAKTHSLAGVENAKDKIMPTKLTNTIFTVGPFASSSVNAAELGANLYFSLLFQESMDAQLKMERDYEIMLKDDTTDEVDMAEKRKQLDYADNLLGLNILYSMTDEELES